MQPAPPDSLRHPLYLTSRQGQAGLLLLLLFLLGWDLRAVLLDQRLPTTDATLGEAFLLLEDLRHEGPMGLLLWLQGATKGPLAPLLALPLQPAVGDLLLACRLVNVLLNGVVLALVCLLARRLTSLWGAGLLAALVCGVFPGQFGWYRLESYEPLMTLLTLLTLWLLLGRLDSRRAAVKLGLVLGLGLLAKTSFPLFVVLPLLWFLATRVRSRADLARLGLVAAVALASVSWWLLPVGSTMLQYTGQAMQSLEQQRTFAELMAHKLQLYFVWLDGVLLYMAAALAGGLLAWWTRACRVRGALLLLGLSLGGGMLLLVVVFDAWSRYMVPGLPVAGLLLALGLTGLAGALGRRLGRGPIRAGLLLLAAGLLGTYVLFNLGALQVGQDDREQYSGLVVPDRRPHRALPRAVAYLGPRMASTVLILANREFRGACPVELFFVWRQRGLNLEWGPSDRLGERLDLSAPFHLLLCHDESRPQEALASLQPDPLKDRRFLARVAAGGPRLLRTFEEPSRTRISIFRVGQTPPGWRPPDPAPSGTPDHRSP